MMMKIQTLLSMTRMRAILGLSGLGSRFLSTMLRIPSQIQDAIAERAPVVALESAIITHGMPFPDNIDLALAMEAKLRQKGVMPATVGVVKGQLVVGLSADEIESLGRNRNSSSSPSSSSGPTQIVKVSRRDFPYVMAHRLDGGTTVSGTIIGAKLAGIPIFATGGLGGVHRGAEDTYDVSADLRELGRNSIAVVSAGIKSILDIGKTLEYLETEGVCVAVLKPDLDSKSGGSGRFPSFFTAESQFSCPYTIQDEVQGARLIQAALESGLESGLLIAVPIPKEFEASGGRIEAAIQEALDKAKALGIHGRALTPFLLGEINTATGGESLEANKRLVENNVRVAGNIALELAKLRREKAKEVDTGDNENAGSGRQSTFSTETILHSTVISKFNEPVTGPNSDCIHDMHFELPAKEGPPVVIGGSSLDLVLAVEEAQIVQDGRTHSARIRTTPGGVARNMAEALARLGKRPFLISAIGEDLFGQQILENVIQAGIDTGGILISSPSTQESTAIYSAVLSASGECLFGLGDMHIHDLMSPSLVRSHERAIASAPLVVLDTNTSVEMLAAALQLCSVNSIPVWLEPTELRKAKKVLETPSEHWSCIQFMSPNMQELISLASNDAKAGTGSGSENLSSYVAKCFDRFTGLRMIMLTRGREGFSVFCRSSDAASVSISASANTNFPPPRFKSTEIVQSVSGAGDCLNAGFIAGLLEGRTLRECAARGTACAKKSLLSTSNVPPSFN